jgi:hypothetical protein
MISARKEASHGWQAFIDELQANILPIYLNHEMSFDTWGVHGRMHICRSLLFAELMARFYKDCSNAEIDCRAIRVATAFHDSGREANGVDLWEEASKRLCFEYVERRSLLSENSRYARFVSSLIDKRLEKGNICKSIVRDADVIEIMRPCCGHGGLPGFKRDFLYFLGKDDRHAGLIPEANAVREGLIQEAWNWIKHTEIIKFKLLRSNSYMADLLEILSDERQTYPMLSTLL